MIYGYVRDYVPMVLLALPCLEEPVSTEFVVDTGFAGDLAIPTQIAERLNIRLLKRRKIRLADGAERACAAGAIQFE